MVYYVLKNETKIFVDSIHADHHHPTPSFLFFLWFILTSSVIVHPGKLLVKITLSSNVLLYDAKNGLYIVT